MRYRIATALACLLLAIGASAQDYRAPVEWELNVEGGVDFRGAYRRNAISVLPFPPNVIEDGFRQNTPAAFLGVSAMRRIPNLRAFYGLRLDGMSGELSRERDGGTVLAAEHMLASATLAYRAFPFDLQGDCDCPTWGNDPWLKKALFVELGLGVGVRHYGSERAGVDSQTDWGGAYTARLGVSHRLSKALDVYLAAGAHGIVARDDGFGLHDAGIRPALGLTWRPRG